MCSEYLESRELINDFHEGRNIAFNAINKRLFPEIYTFCSKFLDDRHQGKDITQDTLSKLWLKRKDFDSFKDIRAFMYVTSRNACLDYLRYLKKRKNSSVKLSIIFPEIVSFNDELDGMYRHFVWKVVEQLPERQRQAIELLYREEKKLLEAAKEMKISVEGVKKLRSRGIDEIRKKINARGVDLMREIFASYSSTAAIVLLVLLICFMSM